jgi:hypothetical protein
MSHSWLLDFEDGLAFMRNEPMVVVISPRDFLTLSMAREMTLRLVQ